MPRVYKHCVVGHGLTGTAACKYLARAGEDVVLVGPSEGHGAHGACYDEGRIYRILDPMQSWAVLAEQSIAQYADIASESHVEFYEESGLLIFGMEDDFMRSTEQVAAKMKTPLLRLSNEDISIRYPWMGIPASSKLGLLQDKSAGHLSPRKLTEAQLMLAVQKGAAYVDSTVDRVAKRASDGVFEIHVSEGETVLAENVLVAAGCYTSALPLLPEDVVMNLKGSQALLAEVSAEAAAGLKGMPSLIYEGETADDCWYLLPPILYPDGKWLIKIGPCTCFSPPLKTAQDMDKWFARKSVDSDFEAKAKTFFVSLFPGVAVAAWRSLLCVTDETPTQRLYIDRLEPGWGICTGGNGWAAKSSDAIGSVAAQMMYLPQHWTPDPALPQSWFRAVTKKALVPTPQLMTELARVEACGNVMIDKAVEALSDLTTCLAQEPRLRRRPAVLAERLRQCLLQRWGPSALSILCTSDPEAAWAPGHPFVALRADELNVVVVLES